VPDEPSTLRPPGVVTDDELRAEIERRGLLVPATANDPHDGYYATDPARQYTALGTFDTEPMVWRSDVTWTARTCEVCLDPSIGMAYLAHQGYRYFCAVHLPELSAKWTSIAVNGGGDPRYWSGLVA
jgi:hypothetical protein